MKKIIVVIFVVFAFVVALSAQSAPKKVLDQKTLDRFLSDYPKIETEGAMAGIAIGDEEEKSGGGDVQGAFDPATLRSQFDVARKDPKVTAFIRKFGWQDSFWDVLLVVSFSSIVVSWEQVPQEARTPEYDTLAKKFRDAVNPADLALVRANYSRISEAFDFGPKAGNE